MKRTAMQVWCDRAWLYVIYALGLVMLNVLIINWPIWGVPQRLICLLTVLLPAHVFEENSYPGGFFYVNNLEQKSDDPMVYPQNMVTNMFTNLTAEVLFIWFALCAVQSIPNIVVTVVVLFGIGETVHHTRDGVLTYRRYHGRGKRTLYAPGVATSYMGLLELSVYGIWWLSGSIYTLAEFFIGLGIVVGVIVFLILVPFAISRKVKSQRFAFTDKGYFDRFD